MRKNKGYSANELMYFIDLYLNSGISYKELIKNYGLKLDNNTYSRELKIRIIKEYLKNEISYRELATKYQIPSNSTVRSWVLESTNGKENQSYSPKPEVYSMKSRKTTLEERIKIVEDYLTNQLTYTEAAEKHQINYNNIYSWVAKYMKHRPTGLKDGRGRGKSSEIQSDTEKLKAQNAVLKAQNQWLKMENEVLKKAEQIERELMSRESDNWPPTKR